VVLTIHSDSATRLGAELPDVPRSVSTRAMGVSQRRARRLGFAASAELVVFSPGAWAFCSRGFTG
jgi:hypothetical protein